MERGYWIRSKPVYSSLVWQQYATSHLVLVEGIAGAMAAIKLYQQMQPQQATKVFYVRGLETKNPASTFDYSVVLSKVVPDELHFYDSVDESLTALNEHLLKANMGLRIYVAGSEKFIWDVAKMAMEYGIDDSEIMKELTGTLARSVYCVHCKTISHEVHANIKTCDGCGKQLFVRDHFSRNLGVYMGLMVDAEDPGQIPNVEEIYP